MFTVKDYCKCCQEDAYGGSIELVEAGIEALLNELRHNRYESAAALSAALEQFGDDILEVSTSILPLINLLIKVFAFAREKANEPDVELAVREAIAMLEEHRSNQSRSTENIGKFGARLIPDGGKFGTFSTSGTVMAVLSEAVKEDKKLTAVCFEARPHNEGYRTLREIAALGIPTTLGVDALLCCLLPKCDIFMIGVDAITATGEVYAKTGSYLAALACKRMGIPFYVAADSSKFDSMSVYGFPLKSSARPAEEVTTDALPANASVVNISFELVPADLITGVITEKGVVPPAAVAGIARAEGIDDHVIEKLSAWINADRKY